MKWSVKVEMGVAESSIPEREGGEGGLDYLLKYFGRYFVIVRLLLVFQ